MTRHNSAEQQMIDVGDDTASERAEPVKVAVRLRPLSEHENQWSAVECLRVDATSQQVMPYRIP